MSNYKSVSQFCYSHEYGYYFAVFCIIEHENEVFLNWTGEHCSELFKSYKFMMNGKPVDVKSIYRYLAIDTNSINSSDGSIDLVFHYVIDIKDYGYTELKKFDIIKVKISDEDSFDNYEEKICDALREVNKESYSSQITSIGYLTTIDIDISDEIKVYEFDSSDIFIVQ